MDKEQVIREERINRDTVAHLRNEVLKNDHMHQWKVFILGVGVIGLGVAHSLTKSLAFLAAIPFIVVAMLGLIIRLEVMVHRPDGFLKQHQEEWDQYRSSLSCDKTILGIADFLAMVPVGYYLSKSLKMLYTRGEIEMLILVSFLLIVEIILWPSTVWFLGIKKRST